MGLPDCLWIDGPAALVLYRLPIQWPLAGQPRFDLSPIPTINVDFGGEFSRSDPSTQLLRIPTGSLANFGAGDPISGRVNRPSPTRPAFISEPD